MGLSVMIEGNSGVGKSSSIQTMLPEEVGIFEVEKQRLPFKSKDYKVVKNSTYNIIGQVFKDPKLKAYVIDDSQYLMVNELFDRAKETGYQKFTDLALHFRNLIHYVNTQLPDDVIVYFMHHTEVDSNTGNIKAKTVGKMLDNMLTVEGCFDIVLWARMDGLDHVFQTQTDGVCSCKSPEGMFEKIIPNDCKTVDTAIRNYYGYTTTNSKKADK
jgi:hypothetical protein